MADHTNTKELSNHDKQQTDEEEIVVVRSIQRFHGLHRTQEEHQAKLQSLQGLPPPQVKAVKNTNITTTSKNTNTNNKAFKKKTNTDLKSTLPVPTSMTASATTNQGLKRSAEDLEAKRAAVSGVIVDSGQTPTSSLNVDMIKPVRGLGRTGYELTSKLASVHGSKITSSGRDLTQHSKQTTLVRGLQRTPQEMEAKRAMIDDSSRAIFLDIGRVDENVRIDGGSGHRSDSKGFNVTANLDLSASVSFQDESSVTNAVSREQDQGPFNDIPRTDVLLVLTPRTAITHGDSNLGLVEATLIVEPATGHLMTQQAQPMHPDMLALQPIRGSNEQKYRRFGYGLVALSCVTLAISLGLSLGKRNAVTEDAQNSSIETTGDLTLAVPPIANLQLLYDDLPYSTKQRLSIITTPQRRAWEWLFDHQNITTLPEWKKKQIFALATIYYSLEGPHWAGDFGNAWMDRNNDECTWNDHVNFGLFNVFTGGMAGNYVNVTSEQLMCNKDGEVWLILGMYLELANWTPFLPPEIALLTSLTTIVFLWNGIQMPLSEFLPLELFHMPNLLILVLYNDACYGTIPSELAYLKDLKIILFSKNSLSGSIPSELSLMTELHILSMNENSLTGKLPTELGCMTSLNDLQVVKNQLSGSIPSEMGMMLNLTQLYLHGNSLTSSLPSELGLLTSTSALNLFYNSLTGQLPSELGLMTNMEYMNLYKTFLRGVLPTELGLLTHLLSLKLFSNQLSGQIPSELGMLTNLIELSIDDNVCDGSLPTELGMLTALLNLEISYNHISGPIPSEIGLLSNLYVFSIHTNNLAGSLPRELLQLANITQLFLGSNNLSGTIPHDLWHLSSLQKLDISELPLLTASLPSELSLLSSLGYLNLTGCVGLFGTIPAELCYFQNVSCFFGGKWEPQQCSLSFDCIISLCGCDCPCVNPSQ